MMIMISGDKTFDQEEEKHEEKRILGSHSGAEHGQVAFHDDHDDDDETGYVDHDCDEKIMMIKRVMSLFTLMMIYVRVYP